MIVCEVAGATSVSHGEAPAAADVVYAWMSTVLPLIVSRTIVAPLESPSAGAPRSRRRDRRTAAMFVSQVYGAAPW